MNDKITIKGTKEHNLKNINLEIQRDKGFNHKTIELLL